MFAFLIAVMRAICFVHLVLLDSIVLRVFGAEYKLAKRTFDLLAETLRKLHNA